MSEIPDLEAGPNWQERAERAEGLLHHLFNSHSMIIAGVRSAFADHGDVLHVEKTESIAKRIHGTMKALVDSYTGTGGEISYATMRRDLTKLKRRIHGYRIHRDYALLARDEALAKLQAVKVGPEAEPLVRCVRMLREAVALAALVERPDSDVVRQGTMRTRAVGFRTRAEAALEALNDHRVPWEVDPLLQDGERAVPIFRSTVNVRPDPALDEANQQGPG